MLGVSTTNLNWLAGFRDCGFLSDFGWLRHGILETEGYDVGQKGEIRIWVAKGSGQRVGF